MKSATPKDSPANERSSKITIKFADEVQAARFVKRFGSGSQKFEQWLDNFLSGK